MKGTLALIVLGLGGLSAWIWWTRPEANSRVPVLYWITANDSMRQETIREFETWLKDNHLPPCEVRVDNVNQDPTKKLAQGLAGVGADLYDIYQYDADVFSEAGVLLDVTAQAEALGFSPEATYPAVRNNVVFDGKQYGFPRNAGGSVCWINRDAWARRGVPEPPMRWSWDEFERLGRQFVAAANPPGTRERSYFIQAVSAVVLRRGLGLDTLNETMTRSELDDPRNAEVMRRIYRWTVEERLVPTQAEQQSMSANSARAGDAVFTLFAQGRYGMLFIPRWALIRLRPLYPLDLRVVEPFNSGFPNTDFGGGMVSVYAGTKHPREAVRFLQFLTSARFNLLVAREGDSLPPVPQYTRSEAFLHPPQYPKEWGVDEALAHIAADIGIAYGYNPYILLGRIYRPVTGIESEVIDQVLAGRLAPEEAGRVEADRINARIALNVKQDPELQARYERDVAVQRKIDARRAKGEPVPLQWITNPFYRKYYAAQGWLEREPAAAGAARTAKP